jgi:hypothetical protein
MQEIDIFDVDDVLINIRDSIQTALDAKLGININWQSWYTYNLHTSIYQVSLEDFLQAMLDGNAIENSISEIHKLEHLINYSRRKIIVTNRGWHPQAHFYTYNELRDFVNDPGDYHYLVPFVSIKKADYIYYNFITSKEMTVKRIFEDSDSFCTDMIALLETRPSSFDPDFKIILIDRPWNQGINHEKIERIFC